MTGIDAGKEYSILLTNVRLKKESEMGKPHGANTKTIAEQLKSKLDAELYRAYYHFK